jgi:hypothetical protein
MIMDRVELGSGKRSHLVFIALTCVLLVQSSCLKDEEPLTPLEQLPDITMEGLNTFGCLINGELFKPNYIVGNPNPQIPLNFSYHEESGKLDLLATMRGPDFFKEIWISAIFSGVGMHDILPDPNINRNYSADAKTACIHKQITAHQDRLLITHLDKENNIIAAEFSFEVVNESCPQDTFRITHGRFDIKYRD